MDRDSNDVPKYVKHAIYIIVITIAAAFAIFLVALALGSLSAVSDYFNSSR
jgi:hypothetical protein